MRPLMSAVTMMLPSGWAQRDRYAGDSSGLLVLPNSEVAGVFGRLGRIWPSSVGGLEE